MDSKYMEGIVTFEGVMAIINKAEEVRTRMPLDREMLKLVKGEEDEKHNYACLEQVYKKL